MSGLYIKLAAAVAPAIVIALMMIRKDKGRPEPIGWLLAAVGLGIVSALAVIVIGMFIPGVGEIDSFSSAFYNAFVGAAIPEEAMKLCMLAIIANRCRHFDEYFDGIVYAVCIGMGFAGFENILYLIGDEDWILVGISRALLSVPAHSFFAIIMGSFFALSFFDKRNRTLYRSMAFIVPMLSHGLYDFLLMSADVNEGLSFIILILFIICFRKIRKYSNNLVSSALKLDSYGYPIRE